MSDQVTQRIYSLFNSTVDPISVAILYNSSDFEDFLCTHSLSSEYMVNKSYSLYSLPSLMRVLVTRNQVLDDKKLDTLYSPTKNEVCYIHEWKTQSKKIFIFDFTDIELFEREQFNEIIRQNKTELEVIFQSAFNSSRGQS